MAKTNHLKRSVPRLITPIALAIALAACSSSPSPEKSINIAGTPSESVQEYMLRADTNQNNSQNDWLIMALKAAIAENDISKANLLSSRLSKQDLTDNQKAEWQLARAQILVKRDQDLNALNQLVFQPEWQLSNDQWLRFYQTRAEILTDLQRWGEAALAQNNVYNLSAEINKPEIAEQIWQSLSNYSSSELQRVDVASSDIQFRGWVDLAIHVKSISGNFAELKNTVQDWITRHPSHPAAIYTPRSISALLSMQFTTPQHTALLLPLSGKFAKQAQIIRDGFMFAMVNDKNRDPNTTLQVFDTQAQPVSNTMAQLASNNIDFIIGPLIKDNILQLKQAMKSQGRSVPMLALNIPDTVESSSDSCYFTLSPEQEAGQAAKYLATQGYQFPMVIAQSGSYGERVVDAFNTEWAKQSDHKVVVSYVGDKSKLQRNINTIFGLQESQQNIAQMRSILGLALENQPRSRRDIDAVYIIADSSDITLIKPFIEVAVNPDAKQPQLLASSRSNTGGAQYEDLSNMLFSDIPLIVSPDPVLKEQMHSIWPSSSNAETRLRALGMDAYTLIKELPQMKAVNGYQIPGQTGVLSVDAQCVVQREMSWKGNGAH